MPSPSMDSLHTNSCENVRKGQDDSFFCSSVRNMVFILFVDDDVAEVLRIFYDMSLV